MSEHIPAWKRIGLKVKESLGSDPLAITEHLDSGKVTKKQVKQLNKRKIQETSVDGEKKPPKRVKVAKSERAPPPEKDQLVYLKSYTTDKENWKFSKQKQNWILKHIKTIETAYEQYLVNYLEGLQGGSRDRLVSDLRKVVESWNTTARDPPQEKAQLPEEQKEEAPNTNKAENKADGEKDGDLESVDADYATRAKKIIETITGEDVVLEGIEEKSQSDQTSKKDKSEAGNIDEDTDAERVESSDKIDNLIIEQVEVTDFVTEEDYVDPTEEQGQSPKEDTTEIQEKEENEHKSNDKTKEKQKKKKKKQKKSKQEEQTEPK